MSRLTDLLRQVRTSDAQLAKDLEAEIAELTNRRTCGLVFEPHQPEAVELPSRPVRRGDKVRILPPRGETKTGDTRLWRVRSIERADGHRLAHLIEIGPEEPGTTTVNTDDLVVVAEFNDRIYPGLVETGRVERGEDKPFHAVINAENYHALEMLTYTHRHSIDAIYIDPPYNSGAKDWKYNNNYVESDDDYRHSKWLAFMERRLKIARELLNPDDSVLIVTVDEKEYLRLGMLLEQTYPEAVIQMVTSVINPMGSRRAGAFSRIEEYIFFVLLGTATIPDSSSNMLSASKKDAKDKEVRWTPLNRDGSGWQRSARPNLFYPIFVGIDDLKVKMIGEPISLDTSVETVEPLPGCVTVWPKKNEQDARWQVGADTAEQLVRDGYLTVRSVDPERGSGVIRYLTSGHKQKY